MTIDYRNLLKDCIRGQIYDWDVPAFPCPYVDEHEQVADADATTDEEAELFFALVREVLAEEGQADRVDDVIVQIEQAASGVPSLANTG